MGIFDGFFGGNLADPQAIEIARRQAMMAGQRAASPNIGTAIGNTLRAAILNSRASSAEKKGNSGARNQFTGLFANETPKPPPTGLSTVKAGKTFAQTGSRLMSDLQRDFGLAPHQAAGFVGNLGTETGGFKHFQEINPTVKGSRGGFGFAQWTGPRRRAFEAFVAERGLDPKSYEANYGFLRHELTNTPEGRVLDSLKQAPDASTAADVVSDQFLRPGVKNRASRQRFTQQALNLGSVRDLAESSDVPFDDLARRAQDGSNLVNPINDLNAPKDGVFARANPIGLDPSQLDQMVNVAGGNLDPRPRSQGPIAAGNGVTPPPNLSALLPQIAQPPVQAPIQQAAQTQITPTSAPVPPPVPPVAPIQAGQGGFPSRSGLPGTLRIDDEDFQGFGGNVNRPAPALPTPPSAVAGPQPIFPAGLPPQGTPQAGQTGVPAQQGQQQSIQGSKQAQMLRMAQFVSNKFAQQTMPGEVAIVRTQLAQMMKPVDTLGNQKKRLEIRKLERELEERGMFLDGNGRQRWKDDQTLVVKDLEVKPKKPDILTLAPNAGGPAVSIDVSTPEGIQQARELLAAGTHTKRQGTILKDAPDPDVFLRKELGKKTGEIWAGYKAQGTASGAIVQDMLMLDELANTAPQGPLVGRLAAAFPGVSSSGAAVESIVKRLAPQMRAEGSGSTSDIEYAGMLQSLPALRNHPEANRLISAMMKAKHDINIERADTVIAFENGDLKANEARTKLAELNRRSIMTPEVREAMIGIGVNIGSSSTKPAVDGDGTPEGLTPEEWNALTPEEQAEWLN